jgi:hypothetical protein
MCPDILMIEVCQLLACEVMIQIPLNVTWFLPLPTLVSQFALVGCVNRILHTC